MRKTNVRDLLRKHKSITLLAIIAATWLLFGYLTYDSDLGASQFLTARNLSNLLRQMAITGLLASVMVFVIVAGEIDLSVGSLLGLLGGLAAVLDVSLHCPAWLTVGCTLALGVLLGLGVGLLVAYQRVPSFIVTLGGMLVFRGAVLGVTGGVTLAPTSNALNALGQGYLPPLLGNGLACALWLVISLQKLSERAVRRRQQLPNAPLASTLWQLLAAAVLIGAFVLTLDAYQGVPIPVLVLLLVSGVFSVVARRTVFGRYVYAIGSNAEATRLSGVDVAGVKLGIFALTGLMCGLAGLSTTARLAAGTPSAGTGAELDAIASCFIGGTSMRGGIGSVGGALVGALIMASLDNGMSMLNLESYWQMMVKGMILVLSVWVDIRSSSRAN